MQQLMQVLLIVGAGLILWFLYSQIRRNPAAFSKKNLNQSFFTLGVLALFLIGIIGLAVIWLKHG